MFEAFLSVLAKVLEFPTLAPDPNGACLIEMKKSGIPLLFELDEQIIPHRILLSSEILPFPMERRSDFYEACLKANSVLEETVSIIPDADHIYLHRWINPETPEDLLEAIIEAFLEDVMRIREGVEKLLNAPPKHLTIPPGSSSIEIFPYKA